MHKPFREIKPINQDKERIPCAPFHAGVELRGYGVSSAIRNAAVFSIAAPGDDAVLTLRQNDRQRELWLSPKLDSPLEAAELRESGEAEYPALSGRKGFLVRRCKARSGRQGDKGRS